MQDRKLRAHFEELKREAEALVSPASNATLMHNHAEIVFPEQSTGVIPNFTDIGSLDMSASLKAHFREQSEEWRGLKQKILEHNTNCQDFHQKIKIALESKGIPVEQNDPGEHSICVFEAALDALLTRWKELARSARPWPDFQNISSNPVEGGGLLYASGWGSAAVAFVKTEKEQEKCKFALAEIAGNMENQREAGEIFSSANELMGQGKEFANQLASELSNIEQFWPGKKTKEFKRLNETCPTCKELF